MPKTKSEAVTMLDAIEQKLGQLKGISSQGKQALADMLGIDAAKLFRYQRSEFFSRWDATYAGELVGGGVTTRRRC